MDRIDLIAARHPEMWPLRDQIRTLGTDNPSHFGNGYTHEGGYSLQQNPDELAALTLLLRERVYWHCAGTYLEIGSASGGTLRWLYESVGFGYMLSIDDGGHHRAPEQEGNFEAVRDGDEPVDLFIFRGDSHGPLALEFLNKYAHPPEAGPNGWVDVAFIDGDHSYEGVKADIALVRPFLSTGSVVIFHDTVACDGVRRAWEEACADFLWPVANYTGTEKPLGIGVGVVK
jgi:cephalosporin hydroxylase